MAKKGEQNMDKKEAESSSWGLPIIIGGILIVGAAAGNMFGARKMMKQSVATTQRQLTRKKDWQETKLKYGQNQEYLKEIDLKQKLVAQRNESDRQEMIEQQARMAKKLEKEDLPKS